jgi:hypothetical protein
MLKSALLLGAGIAIGAGAIQDLHAATGPVVYSVFEPITFGRVEPLHDTGRHRSLSPFWNFNDTGTPHRIQDVARHARPYCLVATTKKFDQSELDHRPALASYSPGH